MKSICIFCGSSIGARPCFEQAARHMGELLAERGLTLVYGGAKVGLMGVIADAALSKGGRVVGVLPSFLSSKEIAHAGLTELRLVSSMHERKATMAQLSSAFVGLPGGFGTFEELMEMLTWSQLGVHRKPCGVLNVGGYFDPLLELLDRAVSDGFIGPEHRAMLLVDTDPVRLLERLDAYELPEVHEWILQEQT